jgi:hypothetical protein
VLVGVATVEVEEGVARKVVPRIDLICWQRKTISF